MRIYGERHAHRLGLLRLNRTGLRFTSLTLTATVCALLGMPAPLRIHRAWSTLYVWSWRA